MNHSENNSRTILSLQALRALGAILIFLHHSDIKGSIALSFGDFAVCCFFMLSGFVLSLKYNIFETGGQVSNTIINYKSVFSFVFNRFKKFAPIYYLTLIAMLVLAKFKVPFISLLCSAMVIQSWIPIDSVFFSLNSPEWFICDILFCYAVFWPIVLCINKFKDYWKIIIIGLLTIYFIIIENIPSDSTLFWIYIFPPMQLPAFMIGMFISKAINSLKKTTSTIKKYSSYYITGAFSINLLAIICYKYIPDRFALSSYWWLPCALLIAILTITDPIKCFVTKILHNRLVIYLGNASMIFYLCHIPWIYTTQIIIRKFNMQIPQYIELPVSILLLAILSIFIDSFILKIKHSHTLIKS